MLKAVLHSVHEEHLMFNVCVCATHQPQWTSKWLNNVQKKWDDSILLSKNLGYQSQLLFTHTQITYYSGVCYNEWMLKWTVFINKIRMLKQTQFLKRTQRNTFGQHITHVCMTCRAFLLWLQRQSSSLLSFIRCIYKFSSVICSFVPLAVNFCFILLYNFSHEPAK